MSTSKRTDLFDDGSPCLSSSQLADYREHRLSDRDRYTIERHLETCSLCSSALAGFMAMPAAFTDIPGLQKSIASKSGAASAGAKTWLIGSLAVTAVAVSTYFLWPKNQPKPLAAASTVQPKKDSTVPAPVMMEAFIRPGAKAEQMKKMAESPATLDTAKLVEAPREIPVIVPVQHDLSVSSSTAPAVIDNTPKLVYNAPVFYILDLKITEFDKYYKKSIEVKPEQLPGTPARFEDKVNGSPASGDDDLVRTVAADKLLKEALTFFNQERYGKCISAFQPLLDHNADDLNANFYTGVSYVRLELNSMAISFLDKVINDKNNVFHEEASWYKAQALIGKGDTASAKTLLQQIVDGKGFYAQQAQEKINTLK